MKKSELRSIIKEVLQEELINARSLTEATEDRSRPNPVLSGGYEDIAFKIHQSDEFTKAFHDDGSVIGDKVYALIKDTAIAKYPKATPQERDKAVTAIAKILRDFVASDDRDSDFFDWRKETAKDKVLKDTHDVFGNEY